MKTKERGLAQKLLSSVCDAPEARFGPSGYLSDLSLRDIADPTNRGLRQPELAGLRTGFSREQSENVYENKGSRSG
jgi:hypothetical protein